MSNSQALKAAVERQPTNHELWRFVCWVEHIVRNKGMEVSSEVRSNYVRSYRRLENFAGFTFETLGPFSMFGGNRLTVFSLAHGSAPATVLEVEYWDIKKIESIFWIPFFDWQPTLEPFIAEWEEANKLEEEKQAKLDRQIRLHRPTAEFAIKAKARVAGISFVGESDWKQGLEQGQNIGYLPKREKWSGETICVSFLDDVVDDVYVNSWHPDYTKWKALALSQSLSVKLRSRPRRYILPAWARYLELE